MDSFELPSGVAVRPWRRDDAPELLRTVEAERGRLARWMPWVPYATSVADFTDFIDRSMAQEREGTGIQRGLFDEAAVVGAVGASIGSLNFDEADVGYWITGAREGRGDASVTTRHLIDWLFSERDMYRITIRAALENEKSRAVAERLGFSYEGVLRGSLLLDGEHKDAALYALLHPEWTS
ncbi:MAG: GNAT family N-acetyltransferase [Acidimicrobiia bacterium]